MYVLCVCGCVARTFMLFNNTGLLEKILGQLDAQNYTIRWWEQDNQSENKKQQQQQQQQQPTWASVAEEEASVFAKAAAVVVHDGLGIAKSLQQRADLHTA